MQRSARILWVAVGVLGLAALAAWWWYRAIDRDLTQPPPRVAAAADAATPMSYFVVPIKLHPEGLEQLATAIPETFALPLDSIGQGNRWIATGTELDGEVRRGPIRLDSVDDGVIVAHAPIELRAGATTNGRRQTLEASADASARITLDVSPDWQLVPTIAIDYAWTGRPAARVLGLRVGFAPLASAALDPTLRVLERGIVATLPQRVPLRPAMERLWTRMHAPLRLSQMPEVWLSAEPAALYLPPPGSLDGAYALLLGVEARLRVVHGPQPVAAAATPLPLLNKALARAPGIAIAAPIDIDYATFEQSLRRTLSTQPMQVTVPRLGEVGIAFEDFKVYPAAPGVVVGAKIAVDTPRGWLDTRGWIYLRGEPVYDAATMTLRVDHLDFSRDIDNTLVNTLSSVVRSRIRGELARAATIDLSAQLTVLRDQVNQRMNATLGELFPPGQLDATTERLLGTRLRASGGVTGLRVDAVIPADTAVTVMARLDAELTLHFEPEAAPQPAQVP